jgi:FkbM family methyltransferase
VIELTLDGVTGKFSLSTAKALELRFMECFGYEDNLIRIVSGRLRPGDSAYDVGSSNGLWTVFLAKAVGERGQVVAFEPNRVSYHKLKANLKLNGLSNVRCFETALGELDGEGTLFWGEWEARSSMTMPPGRAELGHEVVMVRQGDRLRESEGLPVPKVVKIDVEGFEYDVLKGLRQTLADPVCELICCEIHPTFLPPGIIPETVVLFLRSLGFTKVTLLPGAAQLHAIASKS